MYIKLDPFGHILGLKSGVRLIYKKISVGVNEFIAWDRLVILLSSIPFFLPLTFQ